MTSRRGFIGALFAAAAAPAFVRPSSLMPIYLPKPPQLLTLWGDGEHDDTAALRALFGGGAVVYAGHGHTVAASNGVVTLPASDYRTTAAVPLVPGFSYYGRGSTIIGDGKDIFTCDSPTKEGEVISLHDFNIVRRREVPFDEVVLNGADLRRLERAAHSFSSCWKKKRILA